MLNRFKLKVGLRRWSERLRGGWNISSWAVITVVVPPLWASSHRSDRLTVRKQHLSGVNYLLFAFSSEYMSAQRSADKAENEARNAGNNNASCFQTCPPLFCFSFMLSPCCHDFSGSCSFCCKQKTTNNSDTGEVTGEEFLSPKKRILFRNSWEKSSIFFLSAAGAAWSPHRSTGLRTQAACPFWMKLMVL